MAVSVDRWIARLKAVEPHEREMLLAELSRVELESVVLCLCKLLGEKQFVAEAALRNLQLCRDELITRICAGAYARRRRWWQFWRRA